MLHSLLIYSFRSWGFLLYSLIDINRTSRLSRPTAVAVGVERIAGIRSAYAVELKGN